jgi:hypothetical protein
LCNTFAGHAADGGPDRGRGEQRRCEQPHREADRAETGCALADHVIRLLDREVAFEVLGHDDGPV